MKNKSKDFSIIDKELTVDGTISSKGKLVIKGVVKGTLIGETVIIAPGKRMKSRSQVIRINRLKAVPSISHDGAEPKRWGVKRKPNIATV